jgi:hypothetical protein
MTGHWPPLRGPVPAPGPCGLPPRARAGRTGLGRRGRPGPRRPHLDSCRRTISYVRRTISYNTYIDVRHRTRTISYVLTYDIVHTILYVTTYDIAMYDIVRPPYDIVCNIRYRMLDVRYRRLHIVCDIVGLDLHMLYDIVCDV